jgi:hypothetical protein
MIATLLRIFAAHIAPFCPAGPLPMTTRSYSLAGISVRVTVARNYHFSNSTRKVSLGFEAKLQILNKMPTCGRRLGWICNSRRPQDLSFTRYRTR